MEWIPRDLDPGNYGKGIGNVKRRWWPYLEYARPPFDMQKEITRVLERLGKWAGEERVLDVGAGDFSFLADMKNLYSHRGPLTGLEPHLEQIDGDKEMKRDGEPDVNPIEYLYDIRDIEVVGGIAQNMPFPDDSFDLIFARRMMYEIPEEDQERVMQEVLRTMSPDGTFVLTTSGESNKLQHRGFEEKIAAYLNVQPPLRMNRAYTSQRAVKELPRHFSNVVCLPQHSEMVFKSVEEAEDYYGSISTMQDQFDPIPNAAKFTEAINVVVRPVVEETIRQTGEFVDTIEQDAFICWN